MRWVVVALVLQAGVSGPVEREVCVPGALEVGALAPYSAWPAVGWTALFDRASGWTGADGVYTTPLDGDDRPCSAAAGATLWTFGDTFVGDVGPDGTRLPGTVLVGNSRAVLRGGEPLPARIVFAWGEDGAGGAAALVPPLGPGEVVWPLDGWVVGDVLHTFALRMVPGGPFGVEIGGLLHLASAAGPPGAPLEPAVAQETPLYAPGPDGPTTFGRAILANLASAGAPWPDGFLYVYGLREEPLNKRLLVARVRPHALDDFGAWRFWDGAGWVPSLGAAAPIADRLSSELGVAPLADGRVLLVYQRDDFLGPDVTLRLGATPTGPFDPPVPVWRIPETGADPDLFAYGAKAHPHLSRPDRLLVSYHLNTFDFADHFADADIYRPRFVWVPLR